MPTPRKHDYHAMRAIYIQSDISLRALSLQFDANPSVVSRKAKADDWDSLREDFRAKLAEKEVTVLAHKRAQRVEVIVDDFLTVLQATINRLALDSIDRWEQDPETGQRVFVRARSVSARDIGVLIEKMLVLMGQPGTISRNDGIQLTGDIGDLPHDLARQLLRASEDAGAGTGSAHDSPLPRAPQPRQVN